MLFGISPLDALLWLVVLLFAIIVAAIAILLFIQVRKVATGQAPIEHKPRYPRGVDR